MCKGLRDLITDSKAEGREAGLSEGRKLGLNEGRELGLAEALVHTYQKLKQPKEDAIDALIDDYNIPKEDAIELIEKFWK